MYMLDIPEAWNGASVVRHSRDDFSFFTRNSEDIVECDILNTKMTLTKFRKVSPTMGVNVVIMDIVHNNIKGALDTSRNRYIIFKTRGHPGSTENRGENKKICLAFFLK